jgi:hypothetical protein
LRSAFNPDSAVKPTLPEAQGGTLDLAQKEFKSFKKFKSFNLLLTSSPAAAGEEKRWGLERLKRLEHFELHLT